MCVLTTFSHVYVNILSNLGDFISASISFSEKTKLDGSKYLHRCHKSIRREKELIAAKQYRYYMTPIPDHDKQSNCYNEMNLLTFLVSPILIKQFPIHCTVLIIQLHHALKPTI